MELSTSTVDLVDNGLDSSTSIVSPNKPTLQLANLLKLNSISNSTSKEEVAADGSIESGSTIFSFSSNSASIPRSPAVSTLFSTLKIGSPSASTSSSSNPPLNDTQKTTKLLSVLKIGKQLPHSNTFQLPEIDDYSLRFVQDSNCFTEWTPPCKRVAQQYSPFAQLVRLNLCSQGKTAYYNVSFQALKSHLVNLLVTYQDSFPTENFEGFDKRNRKYLGSEGELRKRLFQQFSHSDLKQFLTYFREDRFRYLSNEIGACILTFAEGSFRHRSTPQWHGHIRLCRSAMSAWEPSSSSSNSGKQNGDSTGAVTNSRIDELLQRQDGGLSLVVQHMATFAQQQVELELLPLPASSEVSTPSSTGAPARQVDDHLCLKMLQSTDLDGSILANGCMHVHRHLDGMSVTRTTAKGQRVVTWYPAALDSLRPSFDPESGAFTHFENREDKRRVFNGQSEGIFVDPLSPAENAALLRESGSLPGTLGGQPFYIRTSRPNSDSTKQNYGNDKRTKGGRGRGQGNGGRQAEEEMVEYLVIEALDPKVGSGYRMEVTSQRQHATAFLQTRPGSALQAFVGVTAVSGSGKESGGGPKAYSKTPAATSKQRFLLQCQLRPRPLRPEVQPPRNSYFTKDLRELMQNRSKPAEDSGRWRADAANILTVMQDWLELHPFLPIIGVKAGKKKQLSEDSAHEEEADEDYALLLLLRVQLFLSCLHLRPAGCEVVLDIPFLRGERKVPLGLGRPTGHEHTSNIFGGSRIPLSKDPAAVDLAYTGVPGYLSHRFPRSEGWDQVAAFLWLDPLSYFTCPLVGSKDGGSFRNIWLTGFQELGENYEVLS